MRMKHYKTIEKLYITADSDSIITPGLLCREMLCEFLSLDTPIILASHTPNGARPFDVQVTSLRQLYPYPPIHLNVPGSTLTEFAKHFHSTAEKPAMHLADRPEWLQLYRQVVATTEKGQTDNQPGRTTRHTYSREGLAGATKPQWLAVSAYLGSIMFVLFFAFVCFPFLSPCLPAQTVVPVCIRFASPAAFCSATARPSARR